MSSTSFATDMTDGVQQRIDLSLSVAEMMQTDPFRTGLSATSPAVGQGEQQHQGLEEVDLPTVPTHVAAAVPAKQQEKPVVEQGLRGGISLPDRDDTDVLEQCFGLDCNFNPSIGMCFMCGDECDPCSQACSPCMNSMQACLPCMHSI